MRVPATLLQEKRVTVFHANSPGVASHVLAPGSELRRFLDHTCTKSNRETSKHGRFVYRETIRGIVPDFEECR
jgi:hypothetical protein